MVIAKIRGYGKLLNFIVAVVCLSTLNRYIFVAISETFPLSGISFHELNFT